MILFAIAVATTLTGAVLDENARPLPNAHVYIYTATPKTGLSSLCPSCYRDCGKHTAVDASGRFKIENLDPNLFFDVLAVADGYEPRFARKVDPATPTSIKLRRRSLEESARLIIGTVVDEKNKPIVGAIVEPSGYRFGKRVGYGNVPGVERLSITNERGEFALRIPSAEGRLDVRVTARSLAPTIDRFLVPGENRTIRMGTGATVVGRVVRNGKPVKGARIAAIQTWRPSSDFLGRTEIATDDNGRFTLTNVAANEAYYLHTPFDGICEIVNPATVRTGADGSITDAGTLEQHAGRRIAGSISLPDGYPLPATSRVLVYSNDVGDGHEAKIRTDGTFEIEGVPAGELSIDARIDGLELTSATDLPRVGDITNLKLVFAPIQR